MPATLTFDTFAVTVPEAWELNEQSPPTFSRPDGAGALQFSAFSPDGDESEVTVEDLLSMLEELAADYQLGDPEDGALEPGPPVLVGATFHPAEWLVRVWYLTDGKTTVLATLTADAGSPELGRDLREALDIVRTIAFIHPE